MRLAPVRRPAGAGPSLEIQRLVAAGAAVYDRGLMLPRLIPVAAADLAGPEPAIGRRICGMLARALRAERSRGRAGHWSYDLNRHIGLMQALKAERARLGGAGPAGGSGARPGGGSGARACLAPDPF